MSKEKYLHFIASFLIVLVLTIPFYTTSVYATINKISVKGSDGIEGFARLNDFLNFNVKVFIANDTITPNQVFLGSLTKFDSCVGSITNGSDCRLRFPSNGTEAFEPTSVPFTINLFKDDGTLDESRSSIVTIDNKAPQVTLSISKSKFSSQEDVMINYDITDSACDDPSCSGKCSGIKNIEFFTLNGSFNQTIDIETSECTSSAEISIDSETFEDGENSVFAKATDKFDQVSADTSVTFTIDTTPPTILSNSFDIIRKGISLSTFSQNEVSVDILINVSATDLNLESVVADLSALNPDKNLKAVKASCDSIKESLYLCKWSIDYNPETEGTKTIIINASDTIGNKESITISKSLSLDDQGPTVQSLSTLSGKVIVKPSGNEIIAVFDEATGLSADEVFLHINGAVTTATNCSKATTWSCTWKNVNFGSSTEMSITSDTTDVLANPVSEDKRVNVTIDSSAPILNSLNISPVGGLVPAFPGFFKIGDKIAVVANVTEDNNVFAVGDFSKFISGASEVAGICEEIQADQHLCTWLTDAITNEADDFVIFNFSDDADNKLVVTEALKTFGLENATSPNFWKNTVECSPKTIDRSLGPLINQRVYCTVELTTNSTEPVSTVFIGDASCTGDVSIVDSVETFNTEVGSTSPVIKITLAKDEFKINNASLTCSFDIFSKIGNTSDITKNPEVESAKIKLEFSNLPLGEVSTEVQDKIDEAKDEAEGIFKLIGTLNNLVNIAKRICQLINTIYNIVAVLYFAYFVIKRIEFTCDASIVLFPTICNSIYAMAVGQCGKAEVASQNADAFKKASNWACDIVNCRRTFLWGDLVKNWINDPTTYLGGAGYILSPGQYLGPKTDSKYTAIDYVRDISIGQGGKPRPVSEYMDPQHNLIVATLFVCLPGVIYGLDKWRQIQCLYADCLQNAVGKEGLPVTACEDQKAYAKCKYITGELFAVFPWTAVIDHFLKIIKNALSNPFSALGVAVALACPTACYFRDDSGFAYQACRGARLLTLIGDAAQNVQSIIQEGFTIRTDYCKRLEND